MASATEHGALVDELLERLAVADRRGAVLRGLELVAAGVRRHDLLAVVRDAQRRVGELWQANEWTVAQEHAATAVSEAIVMATAPQPRADRARGRLALVCADGEWHTLPARLAAETFDLAGYDVVFVGGSVPPDHLYNYLPSLRLDAVAVSATLALNLPGAARTVAAVHAAGLRAVVGGAAFGTQPERAAAIGADAWAVDPPAAVRYLDAWSNEAGPPHETPNLHRGAHADLLADRDTIVTAAYAMLEERFPPMRAYDERQRARTREDLDYHVGYAAAALLVRDPDVYHDMVGWLADVLASRGVPPTALPATLDVLVDVLERREHQAAAVLVADSRTALAV
jgi:methanogenic corrinoid protein MtbC1